MIRIRSAGVRAGALAGTCLLGIAGSAGAHHAAISEGFDGVVPLGWLSLNRSSPQGATSVFQGDGSTFAAQAGSASAYAAMDYNATTGSNTISVWLLTPGLLIANGATLSFYTRTVASPDSPDRIEVRFSTVESCDPGSLADGVGDFTRLLLTVNPNLEAGGYPSTWTKYDLAITGLPDKVFRGCAAFRYYVTDGGPSGSNSDYVGIDTFQWASPVVFADDFEPGNTCRWHATVGGQQCP
jgi:hypothetical protein